jgi:DNA polymerase alpha subunit A
LSLDEIIAARNTSAAWLAVMYSTVEKYLDQSGRRWVELGGLFSFMNVNE